ncbi:hypothetical protein GF420_16370 [candidate division GN15 bacterium]|nr:hypothetical protein [candidate division GN15 bacterium]
MKAKFWIGVTCAVLALAVSVDAQSGSRGLTFGAFDVPLTRWGTQQGTIEVTNEAGYLKFLKIETHLQFEGEYLNPERVERFNYILPPGESRVIDFDISVPGNFGKAMLDITVHDVVDTLDDIFPGQDVFRQSGQIRFKQSSEIVPFMQERLTVPPRVGQSLDFDYEFARLLPLFLSEGKSVAEIAALADTREEYVRRVVDSMEAQQYLASTVEGPRPTFPVVRLAQAETLKPLADDAAIKLADVIASNLATYRGLLDSLVSAGRLAADSNEVLDGGTVMYRPYPIVGAMLLWFDLGQEFISDPRPLVIFHGSDPCNANIPMYMYLVEGGPVFNGSHYYNLQLERTRFSVNWGDTIPRLECVHNYHSLDRPLRDRRDWRYPTDQLPEVHILDTSKVYIGLRHLRAGTVPVITELSDALRQAAEELDLNFRHLGFRYWFWNLVADRTLDNLVERGALVRSEPRYYRFEGR